MSGLGPLRAALRRSEAEAHGWCAPPTVCYGVPAEPSPAADGDVAGLLWDIDADDVRTYLTEVDRQVRSLDADVTAYLAAGGLLSQAFLGPWVSFCWGKPIEGTLPGHAGWYPFHEANYWSAFGPPMWSTMKVWTETEAYDRRFCELYDRAIEEGITPTGKAPKPGPEIEPKKALSTEDVRSLVQLVAVVAVIGAVGYGLSALGGLRRSAA